MWSHQVHPAFSRAGKCRPLPGNPVVLLGDDLEEGSCVVSGKVWAEKSLLVERILVSQGMWNQAATGIKGL